MFEEEAKLKGILFTFDLQIKQEEKIAVDKEKLMDCLVNLISNSIKFTP